MLLLLLLLQLLFLLLQPLAAHAQLADVLLDGGGGDALVDEADLALVGLMLLLLLMKLLLKLRVVRVTASLVPGAKFNRKILASVLA